MINKVILAALILPIIISAMDRPGLTPEQAKEVVREYVTKKEGSYIKDSNYYREPHTLPGVVALPPFAIEKEMNAALVDIFEEIGYVCADNKVFIVGYDDTKRTHRVKAWLNLMGKVEQSDHTEPAIASMRVARLQGTSEGHKVLLGEQSGRLLIAHVDSREIRPFGHVPGTITEIIPHSEGTHLAVKYLLSAQDDIRKKIPCVAASKTDLYEWKRFVSKNCEKGIDGIRWEKGELLVQCSESKKWEHYMVENDALVAIEDVQSFLRLDLHS